MKVMTFAVVLMVAACSVCMAANTTIDIYSGWNMIALPTVPINPAVDSVCAGFDMIFNESLSRWDAPNQGSVGYDGFNVPGDFGNMLLGDGYWFYKPADSSDTATQISYAGLPDGVPGADGVATDMWISLPGGGNGGGWHQIGCPYAHEVVVDSGNGIGDKVLFTDGVSVKNWSDAVAANWVDSQMSVYDSANQGFSDMGYFLNTVDRFQPGHGYWLYTYKDNLAMIILAN